MLMCWFALFIPIVAIPAILCVILLVLVVRRRYDALQPLRRSGLWRHQAPLLENHAMNALVEEPRTRSGWGRLLEIEDRIFTAWRLQLYGLGVPVAYALALAWRISRGQSVLLPDGRLRCLDFGWMWLSGKFAASGNPPEYSIIRRFRRPRLASVWPG